MYLHIEETKIYFELRRNCLGRTEGIWMQVLLRFECVMLLLGASGMIANSYFKETHMKRIHKM